MRVSPFAFGSSNRQSSTRVAFSEKSEKFTPAPSQFAPSGYGFPGQIWVGLTISLFGSSFMQFSSVVRLTCDDLAELGGCAVELMPMRIAR
jgi:hypothetical protein